MLKRKRVHDITQSGSDAAEGHDPNANNQLSAAEHEAAARALEEANQRVEAIQSWHRAAIAHIKAGNQAAAKACIVHAEHAAGNSDFSPELTRKGTAADACDGEILGGEVSADETYDGERHGADGSLSVNGDDGEVFGGAERDFEASKPWTVGDEMSARDGTRPAQEVTSEETYGCGDETEVI